MILRNSEQFRIGFQENSNFINYLVLDGFSQRFFKLLEIFVTRRLPLSDFGLQIFFRVSFDNYPTALVLFQTLRNSRNWFEDAVFVNCFKCCHSKSLAQIKNCKEKKLQMDFKYQLLICIKRIIFLNDQIQLFDFLKFQK